jgi:hypothetical protein
LPKHHRPWCGLVDVLERQSGASRYELYLAALEKAKSEKEAHGEFESECPGYCAARNIAIGQHAAELHLMGVVEGRFDR